MMKGFDEFMNVVMTDAEEVWTKKQEGGQRKELGMYLESSRMSRRKS
jgi:small nuclear ribonucleoprotein (snRNP)-like protein